MYFWIYYAIWVAASVMLSLGDSIILTPRMKNKYAQVLLCSFSYLFTSYFKLKTLEDGSAAYQLANVGSVLVLIYYVVLLHKESIKIKILILIVQFTVTVVTGEAMALLVYERDSHFSVDFDSLADLLSFAAVNLADSTVVICTVLPFLIFLKKLSPKFLVGVILFAANQFIMMKLLWQREFVESYFTYNIIGVLGLFAGFLAYIVLFFAIEKEGEQENYRREMRAVRHEMELENIRYEALRERQQELAKLRHDYSNQLTVAQLLIESGNDEEARQIALEIKSRLTAARAKEV